MSYWKYPFSDPVVTVRNRMPNPSMETDLTGYTASAGAPTLTRTTSFAYSGNYSLQATATATGDMWVAVPSGVIVATPGTEYTASAYTRRGGTAGGTGGLRLRFYDSGGTAISTATGTVITPSTAWQRVTVTATAPAGAAYVGPILTHQTMAIGQAQFWDAVMVNTGATAPDYFDGSYSINVSTRTAYRWTGAAHASISTAETPGAGDTFTPIMDIVTPYGISREVRTVARELMESSTVRATYFSPGARSGELRIGCADTVSAMAGMSFFSANATYYLDHSEAYADMTFTVTGGELRFERDDIAAAVLVVPFKEIA